MALPDRLSATSLAFSTAADIKERRKRGLLVDLASAFNRKHPCLRNFSALDSVPELSVSSAYVFPDDRPFPCR